VRPLAEDAAYRRFSGKDFVSDDFSVGSLQATTRSNAIATDDTQRQFNQGDQISVSTSRAVSSSFFFVIFCKE